MWKTFMFHTEVLTLDRLSPGVYKTQVPPFPNPLPASDCAGAEAGVGRREAERGRKRTVLEKEEGEEAEREGSRRKRGGRGESG